jgi:hypothetical protein
MGHPGCIPALDRRVEDAAMDGGLNTLFEFLQSKNSKSKNDRDVVFRQRKGLKRKYRRPPAAGRGVEELERKARFPAQRRYGVGQEMRPY